MENYYTTHKHLPEIPSTQEIEGNGLQMAKGFEGLVYNVELNRLSLTEVYKKLEKLEAELKRLQAENKELKEKLKK